MKEIKKISLFICKINLFNLLINKNLLLFAILFVFSFVSHSQSNYYYPGMIYLDYYDSDNNDFSFTNETFYNPFNQFKTRKIKENPYRLNHINSIQVNYQDPQKDINPYLSIEKSFDKNGYEILTKRYNKKGKLYSHIERKYNDKGILLLYKTYNSKGKIGSWYVTAVNEKGNVTESKSLDRDGTPYINRVYKYNENGKFVEHLAYKGKKQKLFYHVVYSYYSNGDLESIANYSGKGKLLKFWSYACSAKGEEVKNLKDTVKVCKLSDYAKDGSFTLSYVNTGEDGQISKYVRKFDKDSILIESTNTDSKNLLVSKTINTKTASGWMCQYAYYYSKNQTPKNVNTFVYNDDKQLINSTVDHYKRNGKIKSKTVYEFNSDAYLINVKQYNKGGEQISSSIEYKCNEKGFPVLVCTKNKSGIITFKTSYQYL